MLLDKLACDGSARLIKLRRAVTGFAQQDNARLAESIEQRTERRIVEGWQRFDGSTDHIRQRVQSRMPRDVVACRAGPVLRPSLLADQRHEADGAERLFVEVSIGAACNPQQRLFTIAIADRND